MLRHAARLGPGNSHHFRSFLPAPRAAHPLADRIQRCRRSAQVRESFGFSDSPRTALERQFLHEKYATPKETSRRGFRLKTRQPRLAIETRRLSWHQLR
jgi:hypothetical protein